MTRWTDLTERWLASLPAAVVFNAMCRVHRAHVQLLRGEWDDAERGALEVTALLDTNRVDYAAEAWYVIAEVPACAGTRAPPMPTTRRTSADATRNRGGRCCGSSRATRRAPRRWRDRPSRRSAPTAAAGTGLRGGRDRARRGAAGGRGGCRVRARGDGGAVRHLGAGDDGGHRARRGAAGRGPGRRRLPVLRDACRRWHELGAVYDAARTSLQLAETYRALGDEVSAAAEVAKAQATFERLGAHRPAPELPDGLLPGVSARCSRWSPRGAPTCRSARRCTSATGRRPTNIFHKIGVTPDPGRSLRLDRGLSTSR